MDRTRSYTVACIVGSIVALSLSACSYFKTMPRVRPGTDMALPGGASIVDQAARAALGSCPGGDVGPVQVRSGDAIHCTSGRVDTLTSAAPAVPQRRP